MIQSHPNIRSTQGGPMTNQIYQRPLVKCLDENFIRKWVPEPARRRINIVQAYWIIRVQYCGALVSRGVCPVDCLLCQETVVSMFDLENAKNPEALLTWIAKDMSAARIETLIEAQ